MYKVPSSDEMTGDGRGQCVRNSRQGKKSKLSSPKQVPVRRWDQQLNRDEDVDKKNSGAGCLSILGLGSWDREDGGADATPQTRREGRSAKNKMTIVGGRAKAGKGGRNTGEAMGVPTGGRERRVAK